MGEFYVYKSVFLAQISFLIGSTSVTWSSPMMPRLNGTDDNPLGRAITTSENSWLSSISILGACCGSLIYGLLASKFGRKSLLVSLGFPFLIFYLVLAWAKDIRLFYISRFATGVGLGGVFTILPMYCGELADAKNRGILGTSMAVFVNIGMLIPYSIGPFISYFWFQIILAVIPAIYIVLFYLFAPESPHYLIHTNSLEAEVILKKLRGEDQAAKQFKEIQDDAEKESRGAIVDIFKSKGLRKAFIIGISGFTFANLTGTTIIATYSQSIFEAAGGKMPPEVGPIILGVAQLLTTIIVSAVADRFPRKLLLIVSFVGVATVEIPLGIYFYLKDNNKDVDNISWISLASLILFVSLYNVGVGPILLTLLGELFPLNIKGLAVSCMVIYYWGATFVLNLLFNKLTEALGIGGLFWIFSGITFGAACFVKVFLIETKGKTLQEIQEILNR